MLNLFRAVSFLEGLSYLTILSISFGLLSREFVFAIGAAHGVLFMLYLVLSFAAAHKQNWSLLVWLPIFIASLIPFAFIGVDIYLRRSLKKASHEQQATTESTAGPAVSG